MAGKDFLKKLKIPILEQPEQHAPSRWLLRVIALIISVVLWFFVTWDGNTQGTRNFRVDLRFTNLPDGYSVVSNVDNVDVKVSGRLDILSAVAGQSIAAELDLRGLQPGKYKLPVRPRVPANIKLDSVTPSDVDFEIYRVIERTLVPQVKISGEIPPGQVVRSIEIVPHEVVLRGPEPSVVAIREANVEPTFEELKLRGWTTLPIMLDEAMSADSEITITPPSVKIRAEIASESQPTRLPIVAKLDGQPRAGFEVDYVRVEPESAVVSAPKEILAQLKELDLQPIDISDATDDVSATLPLISPNADLNIESPAVVKVTVHFKRTVEGRTYMNVPIHVVGKGVYKSWRISPQVASVMIEHQSTDGTPGDLGAAPLELYVDVTNVVSRQLRLPVLVRDVKEGVTVLRIEPEQVQVQALDP